MIITATEFKNNIGKYLELVVQHDIMITKHGVTVAKLSQPTMDDKLTLLDQLVGIASGVSDDVDDVRFERLLRQ